MAEAARSRWTLTTVILVLACLPAGLSAQAVVGRVIDVDLNAGVEGAQVSLVDSAGDVVRGAVADSTGRFALPVLTPGSYTLRVEHIAYSPTHSEPVLVHRGDVVEVELRVSQREIALEPLLVTARRDAGNVHLTDFYARADRNRALGIGVILTRVELERLEGYSALDAFEREPVRFKRINPFRPCLIRTYWNGMMVEEVSDLEWRGRMQAGRPAKSGGLAMYTTPTSMLEGVEIYDSMQEIPAAYYEYNVCGVILMWSRPLRPGERVAVESGALTRGVMAAGIFTVLGFLLHLAFR